MQPQTKFFALKTAVPLELHEPLTATHDDAAKYNPPLGLEQAMDVAMMLGEPLVLTGAPGAGKTQAAKWLAHYLNAGEVLRFDVKSTSLGADLLYAFDDVARFRDAAAGRAAPSEVKPLVRYLRFNALGYGIVHAAGPDSVLWTVGGEKLQGHEVIQRHRKLLDDAFGTDWRPTGDAVRVCDLLPDFPTFGGPKREAAVRVVLIDELDKAPRDTPNDLLVEVENMTFLIAELGLRVKTDRKVRPIVVITSNAEKPLPEPFMRRCAYFDVPRIRGETLKDVLRGSLQQRSISEALVNEVAEVADLLHSNQDTIHRRPGTAELLAWTEVLVRLGATDGLKSWTARGQELAQSLTALLKQADDQQAGLEMIMRWAEGARSRERVGRTATPDGSALS